MALILVSDRGTLSGITPAPIIRKGHTHHAERERDLEGRARKRVSLPNLTFHYLATYREFYIGHFLYMKCCACETTQRHMAVSAPLPRSQ